MAKYILLLAVVIAGFVGLGLIIQQKLPTGPQISQEEIAAQVQAQVDAVAAEKITAQVKEKINAIAAEQEEERAKMQALAVAEAEKLRAQSEKERLAQQEEERKRTRKEATARDLQELSDDELYQKRAIVKDLQTGPQDETNMAYTYPNGAQCMRRSNTDGEQRARVGCTNDKPYLQTGGCLVLANKASYTGAKNLTSEDIYANFPVVENGKLVWFCMSSDPDRIIQAFAFGCSAPTQ